MGQTANCVLISFLPPNVQTRCYEALPNGRNCVKLATNLNTALMDGCFLTIVGQNAAEHWRRARDWLCRQSCCCQKAPARGKADAKLTEITAQLHASA